MNKSGKVLTVPSLENFPSREPKIIAPERAAHPPTECTKVEPAKSENPISLNQPPPHCHEPAIGYIKAVKIATNRKNGQIRILSAKAPETIEAVVATKPSEKTNQMMLHNQFLNQHLNFYQT